MTKEKIIDNIARLNSETWRDREEVRTEIGKLLAELRKALEYQKVENCKNCSVKHEFDVNLKNWADAYERGVEDGRKYSTSDDCVSREAVLETIEDCNKDGLKGIFCSYDDGERFKEYIKKLPPVTPTQSWIPLVWDEYPTVDIDGNDDYVYAVDYSVPMPKEDEWVLITDENHNVVTVQYDGYDFGDYAREDILAWQSLPKPYEE